MEQLDSRAWEMLTEEEQTALTLQFAHGKSTWAAGEILEKAHYKYLEIKQRAAKFLKCFTEHLQLYGSLTPTDTLGADFKKYIQLLIGQRLDLKAVVGQIDNELYLKPSTRDIELAKELKKLQESDDIKDKRILSLILDFDRWNNFRVLPREFQEPSAYKRRNKNRYKKQLKLMVSLPKFSVLHLEKTYKGRGLFLPVIYELYDKARIIEVENKPTTINKLSELGLYIFHNKEAAKQYIEIVNSYKINETKSCKEGQQFWPKFRTIIKSAVNYFNAENIMPDRKYFLDWVANPHDVTDERRVETAAIRAKKKKK